MIRNFVFLFLFTVLSITCFATDYDYEYNPAYSCCYDGDQLWYGRDCQHAASCGACGVWFPQDPPLFKPIIGDPRQVNFSVGWRFDDNLFSKNIVDVSFEDQIPFYRWCNVWPGGGELQIGLEGGLWALFDVDDEEFPLINADYYVGLLITFRCGRWSYRIDFYHTSSHLGDEFIMLNPDFKRRNPSSENLDLYVSYDWTRELRVYGGLGCIVTQDEDFKCGRVYGSVGLELRMPQYGFVCCTNNLFGHPFYAMHFRYQDHYKGTIDQTYLLGYEFGKMCGMCRKIRFYFEYHDGFSREGQFCKKKTNYYSLRAEYGF